jgi:hypothetical protein
MLISRGVSPVCFFFFFFSFIFFWLRFFMISSAESFNNHEFRRTEIRTTLISIQVHFQGMEPGVVGGGGVGGGRRRGGGETTAAVSRKWIIVRGILHFVVKRRKEGYYPLLDPGKVSR